MTEFAVVNVAEHYREERPRIPFGIFFHHAYNMHVMAI